MFIHDAPAVGQGPHVRRKSVLPGRCLFELGYGTNRVSIEFDTTVDPTVLRDLQAHKSLDVGDGARGPDLS